MLRAGAPLGIYNGLRSVGEGNSADAVALNIVEGILAGAQIEGGMQIIESLAKTYLPKAGAALYEKWLAGGRKASVFSREAREAMVNGLAKELRLAGKEYETVLGGVKDATPVKNKSVPSKTVDGTLAPDLYQSVPTKGKQPILFDDVTPSVKEGNPGVKVEDIIEPDGGKTPGADGGKIPSDSNRLSGPVEVFPPLDATQEQIAQTKAYIEGSNQALKAGKLSPTGRVSTKGRLRDQASTAADKERLRAAAAGVPYEGQVGHVPDTTWTGTADPYRWQDLDPAVNMSIGGQANRYPIGYMPTEFRYRDR